MDHNGSLQFSPLRKWLLATRKVVCQVCLEWKPSLVGCQDEGFSWIFIDHQSSSFRPRVLQPRARKKIGFVIHHISFMIHISYIHDIYPWHISYIHLWYSIPRSQMPMECWDGDFRISYPKKTSKWMIYHTSHTSIYHTSHTIPMVRCSRLESAESRSTWRWFTQEPAEEVVRREHIIDDRDFSPTTIGWSLDRHWIGIGWWLNRYFFTNYWWCISIIE